MKRGTNILKSLLILTIVLGSHQHLHSQGLRLKIFKKYEIKDTSSTFKSGMLVLYDDYTFVNFGMAVNSTDSNEYLWYSTGVWSYNDTALVMELDHGIFNLDRLEVDIKKYYKKKLDNGLEIAYYEFVRELYRNKAFILKKSELIDIGKNIIYKETNI